MPFRMDIATVAAATHGRVAVAPAEGKRAPSGLVWDSREVRNGCLFLCIPGERVDGNDFAARAIADGAFCALMTRDPLEAEVAAAHEAGAGIVVAEDATQSITRLACAWRTRIDPLCVGVTGSVGKTTTKDLLASVMGFLGPVVATKANQNNELGVPATVLAAGPETRALVVEVGMRGRHQIDALCQGIVHPDVGVITNIGTSHLELLGSRENIARAKGELIESLPAGGLAVLPAESDFAGLLRGIAADQDRGIEVLSFGRTAAADVRAEGERLEDDGCASFVLRLPDGTASQVRLGIPGAHNVANALAAAAVAWHAGADAETIAARLSRARTGASRLEVLHAPSGLTVIDDAYNANPDSMRAALAVLAQTDVAGRRIAVLGDMGELGPEEAELHEQVGACAARSGVDLLVCVGRLARHIGRGAREEGMKTDRVVWCEDAEAALAALAGTVRPDDAVLVKASHFMGLGRVAKGLVG